jgi:putative NIF3 family GTP cyclohydrolase 1 type 2
MNTKEIMDLALELAGNIELPADSAIENHGENIKRILFGIDMETPELMLGKELGVDLVISHHPKSGTAVMDFDKVMLRQIDKMVEYNIPINRAQKALKKKLISINMGKHTSNYDRASSAAKLLDMPYMNIHMPADIITENFVQSYLDEFSIDKPKLTLGMIVDHLNLLPEYKNSLSKPIIRVGSPSDYAGKIAVLMAGGTNGGSEVYKAYFEAGVGTIICMHVPEDVKKAVEEQNYGNVIVAGHMSSDSIGINIIIRELEKRGLEIIKTSGIV